MESACAASCVGGSTRRDKVWRTVHAGEYFWRHGFSRCGAERRLPDVECMDSCKRSEEQIAGDGVDSRRRICGGGGGGTSAGEGGAAGRGPDGGVTGRPAGGFWGFLECAS